MAHESLEIKDLGNILLVVRIVLSVVVHLIGNKITVCYVILYTFKCQQIYTEYSQM